jgi:hypothetical protein
MLREHFTTVNMSAHARSLLARNNLSVRSSVASGPVVSVRGSAMCGIVAMVQLDGTPVDLPLLAHMAAALGHPGPDAEATWSTRQSASITSGCRSST